MNIIEKRNTMKIAICDDNRDDLEILHQYCKKYNPDYEIFLFDSGTALLEAFKNEIFDLVFLDIEMGGLNGIEVGQALISEKHRPIIIFTTFSIEYAIRGYGIAIKYLTKPISYNDFISAMESALEYIAPKKLSIYDKGTQMLLLVNDILYLEIFQHQIVIHLDNRDNIKIRGTLSEFAEQLPENKFAQPHKSYLVNMDYIDRLNKQEIILTNGDLIPIGRSKGSLFFERLHNFLKGENHEHRN